MAALRSSLLRATLQRWAARPLAQTSFSSFRALGKEASPSFSSVAANTGTQIQTTDWLQSLCMIGAKESIKGSNESIKGSKESIKGLLLRQSTQSSGFWQQQNLRHLNNELVSRSALSNGSMLETFRGAARQSFVTESKRLDPLAANDSSKVPASLQAPVEHVAPSPSSGGDWKLGPISNLLTLDKFVLLGLFGANSTVFYLWQQAEWQPYMEENFLFFIEDLDSTKWQRTALTANFSHQDFKHFGFNMLNLLLFGWEVGRRYGGFALLGVYLLGGLGCIAGHWYYCTVYLPQKQLAAKSSKPSPLIFEWLQDLFTNKAPEKPPALLGASGSIFALLAVSCLSKLDVLLLAWGAYVLYDEVRLAIEADPTDRIGHAAHLGGALAGFACVIVGVAVVGCSRLVQFAFGRLRASPTRKSKL